MVELNGEAPIDKPFIDHTREKLDEIDSEDDSDTTSNAYETVRDVA